jgi:hypothetical protein
MGHQTDVRVDESADEPWSKEGHLAVAVRYLAGQEALEIDLENGCRLTVPGHLIEGFAGAGPTDLARIEISPSGYGLHWPVLDLDLSVPGLVAGITGTRRWMDAQRAARAGSGVSEAKAAAARRNGAKGGRPRKVPREGA